MENNPKVNSNKSDQNGGNGKNGDQTNTMGDRLQQYAELVAQQKQQMLEVDKQKLVDIIFKQNSVITQQSNQMIDLVNLVNQIESQDVGSEATDTLVCCIDFGSDKSSSAGDFTIQWHVDGILKIN